MIVKRDLSKNDDNNIILLYIYFNIHNIYYILYIDNFTIANCFKTVHSSRPFFLGKFFKATVEVVKNRWNGKFIEWSVIWFQPIF